jgi:lipopolysaccharide export system protein LptC
MPLLSLRFYLSLAGVAAFTWWLSALLGPEEEPSAPPKHQGVDYHASRVIRTETNIDGSPKSYLTAASLAHYAEDDRTVLQQPVLLMHNDQGEDMPPWVIRSETGTVSEDGKSVFLGGATFLSRESFADRSPLRVISRNVTVRPEESYAETAEPVEIFNHPQYTRGVGMQASFKDGMKITLLSQVRDIHESK